MNDLAQLLITFFLTSILGGLFGYYLNRAAFKRQARLDLRKQRYQEGIAFLDALSSHDDRRFFMLQRLLRAVDEQQPERLSRIETEYFQTVLDWNTALRSHRNKARLLVGQDFRTKSWTTRTIIGWMTHGAYTTTSSKFIKTYMPPSPATFVVLMLKTAWTDSTDTAQTSSSK